MGLDVLTIAQGGTCAIIQTECCMYMPGNSGRITTALKDMHKEIHTLDGPVPILTQWLSNWFRVWGTWWQKLLLIL